MITHENTLSIGMFFIIAGFIIIFFGTLFLTPHKTETKYSFVGFIGPFPFGFGNDKRLMTLTLIIGIVLILIFYLFFNIKR